MADWLEFYLCNVNCEINVNHSDFVITFYKFTFLLLVHISYNNFRNLFYAQRI